LLHPHELLFVLTEIHQCARIASIASADCRHGTNRQCGISDPGDGPRRPL
jgi:hypothetical protein